MKKILSFVTIGAIILICDLMVGCSAPDNARDGFYSLTHIELPENIKVLEYEYDRKLGLSYSGIIEILDTFLVDDLQNKLLEKNGWNCSQETFKGTEIKFYRKYFKIDPLEKTPYIHYCKKGFGNNIHGKILFCKDRIYFKYMEILDP